MKTYFKVLLGVSVTLVLAVISTFAVKAVSSCYPTSGGPCLTQAQGIHGVANAGGSYWYASVRSYTTNPVLTLDDIGYGYWNIKRGCNGSWTWGWTSPTGSVLHYTSNFYKQEAILKPSCSSSGARTGYSAGTHDHYKYPYTHLYMFSISTGGIP
jgi:hypothetical protein